MDYKGKIIQVTLIYNDNIISFFYNVKSIEDYKKSKEYIVFKTRFGDQLRENILIDDNKEYIQTDASVFLNIRQDGATIEDFEMFVTNCLMLFDIPYHYTKNINEHLLNSYPKNSRKLVYHNISIINNFCNDEQYILFDYMIVSKKEMREYNYTRKVSYPS